MKTASPTLVVQKYRALIFERERGHGDFDGEATESPDGSGLFTSADKMPIARSIPNIDHRFGSEEATVLWGGVAGRTREPDLRRRSAGQNVTIRISAQFHCDIDQPIIGYTLRNRLGIEISACNTSFAGQPLPRAQKDQICTSDFSDPAAGSCRREVTRYRPQSPKGACCKHDMCDWIDNALVFTIRSQDLIYGMLRMDVDVRNYISCEEKENAGSRG